MQLLHGPPRMLQFPCFPNARSPRSCPSSLHLFVLLGLPDCNSDVVRYAHSINGIERDVSPARRKGRANPVAVHVSQCYALATLPKLTHEAPVLESKAPLQRVEGQVAARALGVVVRAGHLGAGGLEAAAGDQRRGRGGAESGTGEHLQTSVSEASGAVWAYFGRVVEWRGLRSCGRGGSTVVSSFRQCLGDDPLSAWAIDLFRSCQSRFPNSCRAASRSNCPHARVSRTRTAL
jgi:hypothetical protein